MIDCNPSKSKSKPLSRNTKTHALCGREVSYLGHRRNLGALDEIGQPGVRHVAADLERARAHHLREIYDYNLVYMQTTGHAFGKGGGGVKSMQKL